MNESLFDLNFGNMDSQNVPFDQSFGQQTIAPNYQSPYADQAIKKNEQDKNDELTRSLISHFTAGNSGLTDPAWYNSGLYAHKQGSGLGSILALFA